jgi:hypothetical protein
VDQDSDGCPEACTPCAAVSCLWFQIPEDGDGDGCADACVNPPCSAFEPCEPGSYCQRPSCDAAGVCASPLASCWSNVDPVCGCDGVTYQNACMANAAGTSVAWSGVCPQ